MQGSYQVRILFLPVLVLESSFRWWNEFVQRPAWVQLKKADAAEYKRTYLGDMAWDETRHTRRGPDLGLVLD
jgi:hypothetical protein